MSKTDQCHHALFIKLKLFLLIHWIKDQCVPIKYIKLIELFVQLTLKMNCTICFNSINSSQNGQM